MVQWTWLVDAIVVLMAAEACWAVWWLRRRRGTRQMAAFLLTLAAGACLLGAVRAALLGSTPGLLLALLGAGAAHGVFLHHTVQTAQDAPARPWPEKP